MFEKFTGDARQVVVMAQEQARQLSHAHIGTEHLLLALLGQERSKVRSVLLGIGLTSDTAEAAVLQAVPRGSTSPPGHIPFTPRAKKVLELSLRESIGRGDDFIGPEHVMLGLLAEGEGVAAKVLTTGGHTLGQIRAAVTQAVGPGGSAKPVQTGRRTPAAEQALAVAERLAAGAPVGSHHLLEALAALDTGVAGRALAALGITGDALTVQFDAIDPLQTTDATPEQAAAATMSLSVEADKVALTSTDPKLVERVRTLVEQAEGPLTGDGVLAGPFVAMHGTLAAVITAIEAVLNPEPAAPGEQGPPTRLLERLRRLRRSG